MKLLAEGELLEGHAPRQNGGLRSYVEPIKGKEDPRVRKNAPTRILGGGWIGGGLMWNCWVMRRGLNSRELGLTFPRIKKAQRQYARSGKRKFLTKP